MNDFNTGENTIYEIWGAFHNDITNYPNKIFLITSYLDIAQDYVMSLNYEKLIVRQITERVFCTIDGKDCKE